MCAYDDADFYQGTFAAEAGGLNGGPGWVGFGEELEADGVEQLEVLSQAYMVAGHFDDGIHLDIRFMEDAFDFLKVLRNWASGSSGIWPLISAPVMPLRKMWFPEKMAGDMLSSSETD